MTDFSKSQIDKLGDRLRIGPVLESDVILLDEYRRSFGQAYEQVLRTVRGKLELELSGRPAKTTQSIVDKLRRESIRLSQIQDIAGCRLVVDGIIEQDEVVTELGTFLAPDVNIIDRRAKPSFGYRAVHLVVRRLGKLVEIQVRTSYQHLWAEFSEKLSDVIDPNIKYGGGIKTAQETLLRTSERIKDLETEEQLLTELKKRQLSSEESRRVEEFEADYEREGKMFATRIRRLMAQLDELKRKQK